MIASENNHEGTVKAIAYRSKRRESMKELESCELITGVGLSIEDRRASNRQVTLLEYQAWLAVCQDIDSTLSWLLRRANFLIDGIFLKDTIGSILTIGDARVIIHGETKPCALMDYQHEGLRAALKPDWRGGVFAEVLLGAKVTVGDDVSIHDARL